MFVTAFYQGKMDDRREQRIHEVFRRCGVHGKYDINWTSNDDHTGHEITIVVDHKEGATRLASELRACGLMVSIEADEPMDAA
jgi:hypothetical protein